METKAYIAQITKWYVKEIFSVALPPTEVPKVRAMTSPRKYASVDIDYKKSMKFTGNESLHHIDHESIPNRPVFGCFTPDRSSQLSSDDVTGTR